MHHARSEIVDLGHFLSKGSCIESDGGRMMVKLLRAVFFLVNERTTYVFGENTNNGFLVNLSAHFH